ncbi:MAG: HD domain-containing protein [Eubacteriaceae bacterium]|nr:HD domain-containing protein [Eubacteriaceae bacterium]
MYDIYAVKINLPKEVQYIIDQLYKNGYEAYIVGGCVRDSILKKNPQDWDICTQAKPHEIIECFKDYKIIKTGVKHGTVSLVCDKKSYEITTYRVEGKYSDNRHPDDVSFVSSLKEDLKRRDFTINAMAYNHKDGLIDYFSGIEDLSNKVIKCVGNCQARFREDALRILRALRFAAKFNFNIDIKTSKAINENKELIAGLSGERIREELNKLLLSEGAEKILLDFPLVLSVFVPEIKATIGYDQKNPYHPYDIWTHIVKSVSSIKPDLVLRLAMLFHDLGKPLCENIIEVKKRFCDHGHISAKIAQDTMRKLRYDNNTISRVYNLIYYHDTKILCDKISVKRWLNKIGAEEFMLLLEVKRADAKAQNPLYIEERLKIYENIENLADDIIKNGECFSIKDLAVNGDDLISLGLIRGEIIGNTLNRLLDMVIEEKAQNNKKELLDIVKKSKNF